MPPNFWTRSTAIKATGGPAPVPEGFPRIHSAPVPSADKRARKKENARAAREQREAAVKRKQAHPLDRSRSAIVGAVFVGLIVILSVTGGNDKKKATPTTTTDHAPRSRPAA